MLTQEEKQAVVDRLRTYPANCGYKYFGVTRYVRPGAHDELLKQILKTEPELHEFG